MCLSACVQQEAGRYVNPVLHLDYSDPDVCRVGGDYYLTASSFNCMPGLPILHSRDLVHWKQIGYALSSYPAVGHGEGVWAPSIRWHDGWFRIFCGDPDRGIFMVRSRKPQGPWSEPVWVVEAKGFIDPCPFWDDDGRAWLVHGCAGSRAGLKSVLFLAPLNDDATAVTGPSRIIYDGHLAQPTIEGPKVYKRDGWYYIFAPAGGVATGWQTVLRSRSLEGPYEEKIVMAAAPGTVNGPHQGAWVDTPGGGDWFLHFQDKGAYGRIVHLQPLEWREDGWPLIGEDPDGDGVGQPVNSWTLPRASTPASAECFSPYGLPLDWQFTAVPSPYWYCALPGEGFRLYSVYGGGFGEAGSAGLWDCGNLLARKFPAESFTVEASLAFMPNPRLAPGAEKAGFVVMGNSYAGLQLETRGDCVALQYVECDGASRGGVETVVELCLLPGDEVRVEHGRESLNVPPVHYLPYRRASLMIRLEVVPVWDGEAAPAASAGGSSDAGCRVPDPLCRFSYSLDGSTWIPVSKTFIAQPELWIGARFGFYCIRNITKNDSGWLDVSSVTVR